MKQKKYLIPDEIALLHDKATAAKNVRDIAIKFPFGYKKALRAAVDSIQFLRVFSLEVRKLYPELADKTFNYYPKEKYVTEEIDPN